MFLWLRALLDGRGPVDSASESLSALSISRPGLALQSITHDADGLELLLRVHLH